MRISPGAGGGDGGQLFIGTHVSDGDGGVLGRDGGERYTTTCECISGS